MRFIQNKSYSSVLLIFTSLLFSTLSFADNSKALKIAACLGKEIKAGVLPNETSLKISQPWSCRMIHYWPGPSPEGDAQYVGILPENHSPDYLFQSVTFGFVDQLQNPAPVHEYAIFDNGKAQSLMSILVGVQDGFLKNYMRVLKNDYLIMEETVLDQDVNIAGNSLSPISYCAESYQNSHEYVVQYALCRVRANDSSPWESNCFDQ